LIPNADVTSYNFSDATILGIPVSQKYRNRVVLSAGLTTGYALSDLRRLLFVVQGIDTHFTNPEPGQPTNNAKGFLVMGGLDYTATGLWRYRILVGVEVRDFQSPQFKTHTAPVAEGSVIWTPANLTTITGVLARVIEEPAAEETAGYVYTRARLAVDHEYLRNVLLHGRMSVELAQYIQDGGTETNYTIGAGVTWLMNRNMRLSVDYDFTTSNGASSGTITGQPNLTTRGTGGYNRNLFFVAMHVGL
jgi:hypothetical protein